MVMIAQRTRLQIRESVGFNTGGMTLITSSGAGTSSTFKSTGLQTSSGGGDWTGYWLWCTGPTNNAGVRFNVTASTITSGVTTLTFSPTGTAPATSDTAELWESKYDPNRVNEFINQAILEVTGRVYDPEESLALHGDTRQARYDLPSEFAMLQQVWYRASVESKEIETATAAWNESIDADVTASQDTKDYKRSPGSFKMVVAATASANDILATKAITSLDISGYDYVELWIKSTVAAAAGDLQLLLDNTASCASPLETLNIPALTANTWTFVRLALANPQLDTAIISVGLKYVTDIGACTLWVNDIKAVLDSTAEWWKLARESWSIDPEARDLVLTASGRSAVGYKLLKLVGGDKPVLLSADATVCEVDDQFVIARATELLLASMSDPRATYWQNRADTAKHNLPLLISVRVVA